ncbi:aminotransferase class I/II-fold pyridoxal phosphate-dependent enzyme [Paenibacillus sp. sgz302251]|uniref:aminotransferase class I/II-fold pyridoxal phosphate-dependent enzyme n=1 Tax=Paenibacillus sp. sgz302251 TaxID=3414493 RepID=UPI003C7C07DD
MKQFYAPIFNALIDHAKNKPAGFHVPGHRYGQAMRQNLLLSHATKHPADWFSSIMELDVTELSSTDDLHHPEASIKEAQQLAARTFGAEESYFLVGGSTSGNLALILTVCGAGDLIIMQRNVHKSVLNGLKLAGASVIFLSPQIDHVTGLATIPALAQIEETLRKYPKAKAVFLSNPNYYGMGYELEPYVELVHKYNKPLLVDEAHGAHYGFHPKLPRSALGAGADAVVQSAHKTLPVLTMGAMLHIQGDRMERDGLRQALMMIQSSSPSFPILASLDISRAMIDSLGDKMFEQSIVSADSFRKWLRQHSTAIQEVDRMSDRLSSNKSPVRFADPLRVVLYDSTAAMSGYVLQRLLEEQGCYAEMADPRYVVLVFGIQASLEENNKLQDAIQKINRMTITRADDAPEVLNEPRYGHPAAVGASSAPVSFARDQNTNRSSARIDLKKAVKKISAEMVTPYPPGIAILYPGEIITPAIIKQIELLAAAGAKFQGAADPIMATIAVYSN